LLASRLLATGGLGGVHRGGGNSLDISADLTELGRTPIAVINTGYRGFLDLPRTLEYMATQGVGMATLLRGRTDQMICPPFTSETAGSKVRKQSKMKQKRPRSSMLSRAFLSTPVSGSLGQSQPKDSLTKEEVDDWVRVAVYEAESKGIYGAANTPYILDRIKQLSGGRSAVANRAGIEANVVRGTKVTVELAKIELRRKEIVER
jgi:pseudouridylate synthase / pseudouridine kinase